jgi:hypothetical protein
MNIRTHSTITIPLYSVDKEAAIAGTYRFLSTSPREVIRHASIHEEWRHLGNNQNNLGSNKKTIALLTEDINVHLKYICGRNLSPEAILHSFKTNIQHPPEDAI